MATIQTLILDDNITYPRTVVSAVDGAESSSNKVTSISNVSTDTQYPSAKCVYDELSSKQATIDLSHKLDYSLLINTPDAVEANPTVPAGTTPTNLSNLKVGNSYYAVPQGGSGSVDISGKADKVSSPTNGNFAGLDSSGNLTDSGSKASDFLTSHQDISGKADKVSSPTNGNFAGLDSNGNLTDSGSKASDFQDVYNGSYEIDELGYLVKDYGTNNPKEGDISVVSEYVARELPITNTATANAIGNQQIVGTLKVQLTSNASSTSNEIKIYAGPSSSSTTLRYTIYYDAFGWFAIRDRNEYDLGFMLYGGQHCYLTFEDNDISIKAEETGSGTTIADKLSLSVVAPSVIVEYVLGNWTLRKEIPTALSDLTDDPIHRLVTDTEKSTWNGKQDKSTITASADATGSITLADNTEYRFTNAALTSLTIALPASIGDRLDAWISFNSGSTATSATYPNTIK